MAASSPYDNAAVTVNTPVTSQATSSQPGLPTRRLMSADTMKMPEPIIAPTTTIVASKRPSPRRNSVGSSGPTAVPFAGSIVALHEPVGTSAEIPEGGPDGIESGSVMQGNYAFG